MDVEIRHLRSFVAVAEERNFTRAAERLHLAQPALSAQIRQLEQRMGVQLLERTTRKVDLTPAGEALLEGARTLLDGVEAGAQEVQDISCDDPSGGVRDGTTDVAIIWTPLDETGLDVEQLIEEPRRIVLSRDQ